MQDKDLESLPCKPLVSIGMPLYNADKYLEKALESLLAQDFVDFQILISDNASTDKTREICERFSRRDERIRYHCNEKNMGILYNFSHVLEMADTEFFMWAAYDDLWDRRFLSSMVTLLQNNKDAVIAFPAAVIFDDSNPELPDHPHLRDYPLMFQFSSKNRFERLRIYLEADDGKTNLCYGLIRTQLIKEVGGFKHLGFSAYAPDLLLLFRLLNFNTAVSSSEVLYYKRIAKKEENPALPSRIRRFCHNYFGRLDIYLAFIPLIGISDVSRKEKISLTLLVFKIIFRWIATEISNAVKNRIKNNYFNTI